MTQTALNQDGAFEPFHVDRVPIERFSKGQAFGMSYRHLSSFAGGSQLSISLETLAPGRQANPKHYHLLEEEHILVLEGELTLSLGDQNYLMVQNHYVCFPAGQRVGHAITNRSEKDCVYLIIGNPQPADVAVFSETGRIDVKLLKQGFRGEPMAYWDSIDTTVPGGRTDQADR
jgi:uncharacterized cupin superfamily protein